MAIEGCQICRCMPEGMADPDISDYEFDDDDLSMVPIIIPQFHLQAEFPALDSEDSGRKDITGTDVESENQEADREAAADDVLPVQIERRFNKLSILIVHTLTLVPFFLSFCIHLFIPNIKVLTI